MMNDEPFGVVYRDAVIVFYDYEQMKIKKLTGWPADLEEVEVWCKDNGLHVRHGWSGGIFVERENDPTKLLLFKLRWL